MFHNRGKAVLWMDSCVIIMTLRKFPKLYGWAKGNNCWIFLWLSVKLLMLPLLFVIIMPSHNFMVSLKQKRGKLQIGRVFYRFKYVHIMQIHFLGIVEDKWIFLLVPVGFYILFPKLFWPSTVWMNCCNDLKMFGKWRFLSIIRTIFYHSRSEQFAKQNTVLLSNPGTWHLLRYYSLEPTL